MAELAIISIGGIISSYFIYNKIYKNKEVKKNYDIENNNIENLIDICKNDMYNNNMECNLTINERFRLIEHINNEINEVNNSKVLGWINKFMINKELNEMKNYLLNPVKYEKNYYYSIR